MKSFGFYEDVAKRTGGDIFIGVVGPVRTGKSTFIKKFMEELVLPQIDETQRQRSVDELPQSAAGKTVMTTEPKFVPEQAVEISAGKTLARVRLIDCVGYPVEGAVGFEEDGTPRLVKTPWNDTPVPFEQAAQEGTRRVLYDHSTIDILVTTDGSVTGIDRVFYEAAEEKALGELKASQKPFVILLNCKDPASAEELRATLEEKYSAPVIAANAEKMDAEELASLLERVLYEFPVVSIEIDIPEWMRILDADTPIISELLEGVRTVAPKICKMSDCALLDTMFTESAKLAPPVSVRMEAATGRALLQIDAREGVFLQVLGEQCGEDLSDEISLMRYVLTLSEAKKVYARVGKAFHDAQEYGYGIVPPDEVEMDLSEPRLIRKGSRVGVDLQAAAPSYHIIRVDLSGEVRPAVGTLEQSEAFIKKINEDLAGDPEKAWNTNMFGKTLKEMLGEELTVKNRSMAEGVQKKMRKTVTRIVNEGKGGVICILL